MPTAYALPVPDHDPDLYAEMIQRIARHGDRAAFAQLFGYFAPRAKSWLLRQGFGPEAAEEQAVAVMAAVWRQAGRFDAQREAASTWIFRILRNTGLEEPSPRLGTTASAPARAAKARARPIRPATLRPPRVVPSSNAPLTSRG